MVLSRGNPMYEAFLGSISWHKYQYIEWPRYEKITGKATPGLLTTMMLFQAFLQYFIASVGLGQKKTWQQLSLSSG